MNQLADLLNQSGFKFNAILKDGSNKPCEVVKHTEGYYTTSIKFSLLKAWVK